MKPLAIALVLTLVCPLAALAGEKTLLAWEFNTPGQLEGWQPNGHLKDTAVANGSLHTRAVDWDPFLTSRQFDIPARPRQCIEFRIKADKPGKGQFFWTNTRKSKHGGFSPHKTTQFELHRAGQWETVRIHPFWQAEKKIILLRFDLYNAAAFGVDYVRVIDSALEPVDKDAWAFDAGPEGWEARDAGCRIEPKDGMLQVRMASASGRIVAPPLNVDISDRFWVQVRMKVDKSDRAVPRVHGRVWCASESKLGMGHADFVVKADGRFRVYNVDMSGCRHWDGRLLALGITPAQEEGAAALIDEVAITAEPGGPPLIELVHFGFADAINPAGKPATVIATIRNAGGDCAEGLLAALHVPMGVKLVGSERTQKFLPIELLCGEEVAWTVQTDSPGKANFGLTLQGPGAPADRFNAALEFSKPLGLPKASYVPEPRPVPCQYDVGVFYFPGWCSPSRWEPIKRVAPIRKPVLGWYDEANPECADWQIKWAVEHGVKFFMVDWYWHKGGRHLEHWLHDAYMKARYRRRLKFCLMWANHNPRGSHSPEDWRKVTQYWIDHYFGMEEYYRIDDRPAVYIWAPRNIRRDVGGSEEAANSQIMAHRSLPLRGR